MLRLFLHFSYRCSHLIASSRICVHQALAMMAIEERFPAVAARLQLGTQHSDVAASIAEANTLKMLKMHRYQANSPS